MSKRKDIVKVSMGELRALTLLAANPGGLFGSQLVHFSGGFLGRGTVYTTLNRLIDKKCVRFSVVPGSPEHNLDRPLYTITKDGVKVIESFASEFGFTWSRLS